MSILHRERAGVDSTGRVDPEGALERSASTAGAASTEAIMPSMLFDLKFWSVGNRTCAVFFVTRIKRSRFVGTLKERAPSSTLPSEMGEVGVWEMEMVGREPGAVFCVSLLSAAWIGGAGSGMPS